MLKLVAPKKGLSPIISTILLVVIAVILVTLILTWGKETANTNLSRTDDITSYNILNDKRPFLSFVDAKNGMYVFDYFPPANKGDINFTIVRYSLVGYNDFIPLEPEYTFSRTGRHFVPLGIINEDTFTISLLLSDGKYLNFENITNTNNSPSTSDCPEGYIPVPGNHLYGTVGNKGGFCVAKYEMKMDVDGNGIGDLVSDYPTCKNNSTNNVWDYNKCKNGNIVSTAKGSPITMICPIDSAIICSELGSNYSLLTNEEWMTLARNIEMVKENWSTGKIGNGYIFSGHNDSKPAKALEASNDDLNNYYLKESVTQNQKRTLYLSNGEVIWDLTGNVYEWVDANILRNDQPEGYNNNDVKINTIATPWFDFSKGGGAEQYIKYNDLGYTTLNNKDLFLFNNDYKANQNGIGRLRTFSNWDNNSNVIMHAFLRGGGWTSLETAGILSITFGDYPDTIWNGGGGFRCVYTP